MYPTNVTELTALLAVLLPIVIATITGLRSAHTKALENDLVRWRRMHELTYALYNKDSETGLLGQIAAAHELGATNRPYRTAALDILGAAKLQFATNTQLAASITLAQARLTRAWW